MLAAVGLAALLIANPSLTDADRVAANGGFLLGNAHRCGIATDRVVQAGQLIHQLITAAAEDAQAQDAATVRFAEFFLVTAVDDARSATASREPPSPSVSCKKVAKEFVRLERHNQIADRGKSAVGGTGRMQFRLGDGE